MGKSTPFFFAKSPDSLTRKEFPPPLSISSFLFPQGEDRKGKEKRRACQRSPAIQGEEDGGAWVHSERAFFILLNSPHLAKKEEDVEERRERPWLLGLNKQPDLSTHPPPPPHPNLLLLQITSFSRRTHFFYDELSFLLPTLHFSTTFMTE